MPLLGRVGWLRLAHFRVQFAWGLPHVINVYTRSLEVNAVFIQQTMKVAQADQELILKQRLRVLAKI